MRGNRRKKDTCHVCGGSMVALCDASKKDGAPCDLPLCEKHRNRVGTDTDVCTYHNHSKYIMEAEKNREKRAEARLYFMEKYHKQDDFRVVPGHWPDFASKEEVDKWIGIHQKLMEAFREEKGKKNYEVEQNEKH